MNCTGDSCIDLIYCTYRVVQKSKPPSFCNYTLKQNCLTLTFPSFILACAINMRVFDFNFVHCPCNSLPLICHFKPALA